MRKKIGLLFLVVFIVQLGVLGVNADPTTTIVESETIVLDWYYLYQVNEETPAKDTQVVVKILSSVEIDFFVADEGGTDDYLDGYVMYPYISKRELTDETFTFKLERKQMYEFVFKNTANHGLGATVTYSITFIYETSYMWIAWVTIIIVVIGMIIFFSNRYKRRQQTYKPAYQPYRPYAPTQQTVEYSGYKPAQTQITQDTLMAKYCTYCGAQNNDNESYCTNCGSSIN